MLKSEIPWLQVLMKAVRGRMPGQLVIQYTNRCNASCRQCGMNAKASLPRETMPLRAAERLVDAAGRKGFLALSFTGGEPLLYLDDIKVLSRRARANGIPFVRTGTNGFHFLNHERPDFADRIHRLAEDIAGSGLNNFWISLDSARAEEHERNRGLPGVVRGMEKALKIFESFELYPAANLGLNRLVDGMPPSGDTDPDGFHEHFRRAFRRFYAFAESLGFTTVNACYPMSHDDGLAKIKAAYAATSAHDMVRFSPAEKPLLYGALSDAVAAFRHRLRIFTPRSALSALCREHAGIAPQYPCRGGVDFFFVKAGGGVAYPCGYRGDEPLGDFCGIDPAQSASRPSCTACDWECFRDPSLLAGPVLLLLSRPVTGLRTLMHDRAMTGEWLEDLRYYLACDGFDLRTAPDYYRLGRFAKRTPPLAIPCGESEKAAA